MLWRVITNLTRRLRRWRGGSPVGWSELLTHIKWPFSAALKIGVYSSSFGLTLVTSLRVSLQFDHLISIILSYNVEYISEYVHEICRKSEKNMSSWFWCCQYNYHTITTFINTWRHWNNLVTVRQISIQKM